MGLTKYAIYIGIILIVAFFFEQLMTGLYDLTLQGVAGDLNAYFILVVAWVLIYFVARLVCDKKVHPKSSRFALWGGMIHIGTSLAIYFVNSNPVLLIIYPIILGFVYWTRQKRPMAPRFAVKFHPIHPLFIDGRGGVCVSRVGKDGFLLQKFLVVKPPIPVREVLLYFYHEGIEFTFEMQHKVGESVYYLGLLLRGRRFDAVYQACLEQVNKARQFFKRIGLSFVEVSDYLNVLRAFYLPYFLYDPSPLTIKGVPRRFSTLSIQGNEVLVENELEEFPFVIHKLVPAFKKSTEMYSFLETLEESYYFQFHFKPLTNPQIDSMEERDNEEYRATLKRLTAGLEDNSEFQAASYLFNQIETPKENLEPLMDRTELTHLKTLKKHLKKLQEGRTIGLWETGFTILSSPALAQALAVKIGGTVQPLSLYALPAFACRLGIEANCVTDSKEVSTMFPNEVSPKEETSAPSIEYPT